MADSIRFTNSKQHDRQKAAARKKFEADLGGLSGGGNSGELLAGFGAASWTDKSDNFVKIEFGKAFLENRSAFCQITNTFAVILHLVCSPESCSVAG